MVSDSELIDRLREFLRSSDLNTTTTAIVRRKLEEDFGVDLSDRKAFIRTQVDLFLQSQIEKSPEENQQDEEEEDDEKPKLKSQANGGSFDSEDDSEEEEESEEEEQGKRRRKKAVSNNKNKEVKKRGGGGGFAKASSLSPELQKVVGVPELARTEVVRQLWVYIRERNLQDPNNKKNIICDEALRAVFRVDSIDMFQMNKALSKHIWPLDSENAPVTSTPKKKKRKQERAEDSDDPQPKEKRQKGAGSGFLAPLPLSDALAKFIGTGETILPRAAVVKRIWDYIKENNLQDPSDKKTILCDDKLKELFDVDSFVGFTVPKLLKDHFIKPEQ